VCGGIRRLRWNTRLRFQCRFAYVSHNQMHGKYAPMREQMIWGTPVPLALIPVPGPLALFFDVLGGGDHGHARSYPKIALS
jgi:hypothetical protein